MRPIKTKISKVDRADKDLSGTITYSAIVSRYFLGIKFSTKQIGMITDDIFCKHISKEEFIKLILKQNK